MALKVEVFFWIEVFHNGIQGTLVVERYTEKQDALVSGRQGLELETDNKGIIKQLAQVNADLLEQRGLLFLDQEDDAIDIDNVQLAVFHRTLEVDGELGTAHQDDFFDELPEDAFASVFLQFDVAQLLDVVGRIGRHAGNPNRFQKLDVDDVVADVGDILQVDAQVFAEFLGHRKLFKLALKDILDMEFVGSAFHNLGGLARDDADGNVQPMGEENPRAVRGIELLPFVAGLVIVHAAIGPNAVDVGQDQFGDFHGLKA